MPKPEMKWNGHLHRPVKFGEGMRPGTVEWEELQRQHAAERRHLREAQAERRWREQEMADRARPGILTRIRQLFR